MTVMPSCSPFSKQQVQNLYNGINVELDQLDEATIPLVSGLIIAQDALPKALSTWLLQQLAKRTDLSYTSPAAEAALRIGLLSAHRHVKDLRADLQAQFALLKALHMQGEFQNAARFLNRLASQLELNLSEA